MIRGRMLLSFDNSELLLNFLKFSTEHSINFLQSRKTHLISKGLTLHLQLYLLKRFIKLSINLSSWHYQLFYLLLLLSHALWEWFQLLLQFCAVSWFISLEFLIIEVLLDFSLHILEYFYRQRISFACDWSLYTAVCPFHNLLEL